MYVKYHLYHLQGEFKLLAMLLFVTKFTVQGRYVPVRYVLLCLLPVRYIPVSYVLAFLRPRTFHP
jgi:hypothetical protein